jgi:hypothetical protein
MLLFFFTLCEPEIYAKSIFDANQQAETEPNIPDSSRDSIDEKLSKAVLFLDVNGVQQALKVGADPNSSFGPRSLVEMAILGVPPLKGETFKRDEDKKWIREEENKCIEILKKFFNAGAKVKQSYMRWPIESNSVLILKLLLQRGTDLYTPIGALTPIELAVKCNSQDVVDFLIKQGVKPVSPQEAAQLRLLDAAGNHDIIRMERSLREGAKLEGEFKGNRFSVLLIVVSNPISAFESEAYGAVAYLLQKGANPNFEGANGNAPLHLAMPRIYSGDADTAEAQKTYRRLSLQALVKAGANVSSRNDKGQTPLHVAAAWDNLLGAEFLIENGANINLKDQDGKAPLDYAESAEMIKLLKSHGAKEQ